MTIATVVTHGYGSFGSIPAVVLFGYSLGVTPEPASTTARTGGFDAGASGGFGKWFNTAFRDERAPERRIARTSPVGRMLDELVYRAEDEAARTPLPDVDKAPAARIVREAAASISRAGSWVRDEQEALDLVAAHERAYRDVVRETEAAARQAFIAALVIQATARYRAEVAARKAWIEADDMDALTLLEMFG